MLEGLRAARGVVRSLNTYYGSRRHHGTSSHRAHVGRGATASRHVKSRSATHGG